MRRALLSVLFSEGKPGPKQKKIFKIVTEFYKKIALYYREITKAGVKPWRTVK